MKTDRTRRIFLAFTIGILLTAMIIFARYWINTQPIWLTSVTVDEDRLKQIPASNAQIINFIEAHGETIAPGYAKTVCTDFVIKVIEPFKPLTNDEKSMIHIITSEENLIALISNDSPVIKGVQTALLQNHKGIEITNAFDVMPGDFVQLWNVYNGKAYGHVGVILEINPFKTITLYSSHPLTDGYGKQKYIWPDTAFFVRLN